MIFLRLSDGIFGFGQGGINRIETIDERYTQGNSAYKTILYHNTTKIAGAKESLEEIQKLLDSPKNLGDN